MRGVLGLLVLSTTLALFGASEPRSESAWWVAFGSFRDGDFAGSLHAVRPDGSEEVTLWRREGGRPPVLDPRVSPEGNQAVFARGGGSHRTAAWVVDLAEGSERRITRDVMTRFNNGRVWPSARPGDSSFVVVVERAGVRRVELRSLDDGGAADLGRGEFPSWSQDGESLLVSREIGDKYDLFSLHLPSGRERRLTHTSDRSERAAVWSPDGTLIAYSALASDPADGWQHSIFLLNPANGRAEQLTTGRFHDTRPTWVSLQDSP
jgi:Tol biopolymer transport system component